MKPRFIIISHESFSIVLPLKQSVLRYIRGKCPIEVALQYSKEIGMKESEVDKLEWDITREIFTSPLDLCHKIHLQLCLSAITAISDRAEHATNRLALLILKSVD